MAFTECDLGAQLGRPGAIVEVEHESANDVNSRPFNFGDAKLA